MRIAIIGSSGFIGINLVRHLLTHTQHTIVVLCRDLNKMQEFAPYESRFIAIQSNVFDTEKIVTSLKDIDVAYYLIHMLSIKSGDFYDAEEAAALSFAQAAKKNKMQRVIYLSGLGKDTDNLSKHLASRHNTGDILRSHLPLVIEFRASMIIGSGSISFEIVKNLVRKLPIIILPKWSKTITQPIGIGDVLQYLTDAIDVYVIKNEIIEIGGPEKVSYRDFLKLYAKSIDKHCFFIRLPFLPESIAGLWLGIYTPRKTARIGRNMVESFRNEMVVTDNKAQVLFPKIKPSKVSNFFI